MNPIVETIIVGCGVAGATAAETAASLGSTVLVLEEHSQPGVPSHCAGHVGISGMKRFGPPLPSEVIKNRIRGAIFHSPSGQTLRVERPTPVTWVLDRRVFDEHLTDRAEKAGAQIQFNSRAISMQTLDKGQTQLKASVEGKPHVFSCRVVIDCEGAAPTLPPQQPSSERRKWMWVNSAQVHVDHIKDLDCDMVEVFLGSTYAPGFFAWIIPWRDGSAKLGLASREGNARSLLERFMTKHPDISRRLKDAPRRDFSFHPIPLGGPVSKTSYPGLLIAGDSAQQVKPTTGGGIVFSLACGKAAGEVAHDACEAGDASERFLGKYEGRWRHLIGRDLDVMRHIRRMLFRLPDRQLERIFSAARTFEAATVLSKVDDIDMQARTLTRLGLDPRLMISMLYSSILSLPFITNSGRLSARGSRG